MKFLAFKSRGLLSYEIITFLPHKDINKSVSWCRKIHHNFKAKDQTSFKIVSCFIFLMSKH